ncbi:MAG: hypothetical protein H6766_02560 [Candidatus Peribacteria bacterium]|nr:MAG: hypothetical protein H6766_02560 [Candidatus Peribacteria bacterium]
MTPDIQALLNDPLRGIIIPLALIRELIRKGFALRRAARRGNGGRFVALLILNTVGVLPITYLLTHKKEKPTEV